MTDDRRPADGATKIDQADCAWIACCGVWYSEDAWAPPQADVERDPEEAVRTHRVVKTGTTNCPECHRSLRRYEPDAVDAARVLALADADPAAREAAYAQRLRDTVEGRWLRFGPTKIGPGACERVVVDSVYEIVENVAFLSLPASVASKIRVMTVNIGRECFVDGPVPGECFAVRIPADAQRPIDRGGSLARRGTCFPGLPAVVVLENQTREEIEVIGALFAPNAPKLTVVTNADARFGIVPGGPGQGPFGSGGSCG